MIVGGYSLDLYCDGAPCKARRSIRNEYYGQTKGQCLKEARRDGWKIIFDKAYHKECL